MYTHRGILYFAGAMVRVPALVKYALDNPLAPILTGVSIDHPEIKALIAMVGRTRVYTAGAIAKDTVGEVVLTRWLVRQLGITELALVTEPGHLDRAWRIVRILHPDLPIVPVPTASSGYLSSWARTSADIVRAYAQHCVGVH